MLQYLKIYKSRNEWRKKVVERADEIREYRKEVKRHKEIKELRKENLKKI